MISILHLIQAKNITTGPWKIYDLSAVQISHFSSSFSQYDDVQTNSGFVIVGLRFFGVRKDY